jgi:hypothetical protein
LPIAVPGEGEGDTDPDPEEEEEGPDDVNLGGGRTWEWLLKNSRRVCPGRAKRKTEAEQRWSGWR